MFSKFASPRAISYYMDTAFFSLGRDIKLEIRNIPLWKKHFFSCHNIPNFDVWVTASDCTPSLFWFGMLSLSPLSQRLAFFFLFFWKLSFPSEAGLFCLYNVLENKYSSIMEMKPEKDYKDQRGLWTYPKCQQSLKSLSNWLTRHGC